MFEGILKAVLIAVGCVVIPIALVVIGITLSIVGPLAGILMIIFLPMVLVGVIIGRSTIKKKKEEKES